MGAVRGRGAEEVFAQFSAAVGKGLLAWSERTVWAFLRAQSVAFLGCRPTDSLQEEENRLAEGGPHV